MCVFVLLFGSVFVLLFGQNDEESQEIQSLEQFQPNISEEKKFIDAPKKEHQRLEEEKRQAIQHDQELFREGYDPNKIRKTYQQE